MSKFSFLKKMNRNTILVGVAIIGIIITGVLIFVQSNKGFSLPNIFGMSDSQIGKKAIDYINNNQLSQTPVTLGGVSEESGMVKIKVKIGTREVDSYATKDGKLLFPSAIDMNKGNVAASNTPKTPATVAKNDKPSLEAFVVSSCPYGLQMQRAVTDAVKNAPALASNVVIRYIGSISAGKIYSMHDSDSSGNPIPNGPEAKENLRQICIRQEQPAKFWNYLSCYMKKASGTLPNGMPLGDTNGCLTSTGVDTTSLSSCMSDSSRGLAYAKKDFDLGTKYNVSGSPTLVLNGTTISESNYGGRSSDGVKSMVCAGFNTKAGFCSTKLNTTPAAVSFSATYADATGAGSSGNANTQCGS
ncbi:MAG: hypothetical protein NT155_04490 [Candidatus Staskawiczbacteria bacterium]|nr:hypothetical protein [Candidatus Staskawiczbacteria bacterium]